MKDEFDDEKELGVPHISMDELERHLTAWEWDYNNSSHRGIGFLRTLKGVPAQLFAEGMDDVGQRFPIDPEVFARVAGNVHWAAIEDGCIAWDHVKYSSPALVHLSLDPSSTPPPRMKARKSRRNTTLYRCTRDPSDIGGIWVRVPGTGKTIWVPAAQGYIEYASGLRLYQHKEAIKHHNRLHKRPIANVYDLDVALAARAEDLKDIHEERKLQGTADKLAAFFRGVVNKVRRSRLYVPVPSEERSAHRIDDPKAGQPLKTKRTSQAAPDYDPTDSPPKIFTRDEDGRLVPGEPLMKLKPHRSKRKAKEEIEPGEKAGTGALRGYEDPEDISDILARRAEARRNRKK
ncbi:hypothetical protein [Ensifer soli]|uniref:hypothetical protein n=1 Tax=Ciceribacter sp. sgz301302 TaxID=3342379 RepID=UPI0035B6B00B